MFDAATRQRREPVQAGKTAARVEAAAAKKPAAPEPTVPDTIYEAVFPVILEALENPATVDELAKRLNVAKGQLRAEECTVTGDGRDFRNFCSNLAVKNRESIGHKYHLIPRMKYGRIDSRCKVDGQWLIVCLKS